MKEFFTTCLNSVGLAYWVKIDTQSPMCTYYFGPFSSQEEAETSAPGYVEDLKGESAQNIQVTVKRCKPTQLTIVDEEESLLGANNLMEMVGGRV